MSHVPDGSIPWGEIEDYAEEMIRNMKLPKPERRLPIGWFVTVQGRRYPEMWLRYYAQFRHMADCYCMAADYANHMTGRERPIVRSDSMDVALLAAHAKLVKETGETVRSKKHDEVCIYY